MKVKNFEKKYENRKNKYEKLLKVQSQFVNFISILRLFIFCVGLVATAFLYVKKLYYLSGSAILVTLILFFVVVVRHKKVNNNKAYTTAFVKINSEAVNRLQGKWKAFTDNGKEFMEEEHPYSGDLDVFGVGSLFQWLSMATTYSGRIKIKEMLAVHPKSKAVVQKRQEAIMELSKKLSWRQRFMAEGILREKKVENPEALFLWGREEKELYSKTCVVLLAKIIPCCTVILILLFFFTRQIPYFVPLLAVGVQAFILMPNALERNEELNTVYKYKKSIKVYEQMIKQLEKQRFSSSYLKELKNKLVDNKNHTASYQIGQLGKITDLISDRNNFFYVIFNILFLWEYQCMISLQKWKKNSGVDLESWVEVVGEVEALSSFASVQHDHPNWAIPKFSEEALIFEAENMAHPLLGPARVCNSVEMGRTNKILLITGSNMSGKSTLLRTIGINLVLAYAGAPVCAEEFQCSLFKIHTCMRSGDNLEKSISSFYAELLRIKMLMQATKEGKPILFLLDEIFKGTNSMDRHTGAKILIEKLSEVDAVGLVSTHDLELADIEKESGEKVKNYHFREYYKEGKLQFDYKLRNGVSTTRNALYLMKLAGIEMGEES